VAVFLGFKLYCANVGDSRAVLCKGPNSVRLTVDHTPSLDEEKKRIEELGGKVTELPNGSARLNGKSAVSRCLGDNHDAYIAPYLSRVPHVSVTDFEKEGDDCEGQLGLILACDGLWDVVAEDEAAKIVHEEIIEGQGPGEAAKRLVNAAYERGSTDNISVVVVDIASFFYG